MKNDVLERKLNMIRLQYDDAYTRLYQTVLLMVPINEIIINYNVKLHET